MSILTVADLEGFLEAPAAGVPRAQPILDLAESTIAGWLGAETLAAAAREERWTPLSTCDAHVIRYGPFNATPDPDDSGLVIFPTDDPADVWDNAELTLEPWIIKSHDRAFVYGTEYTIQYDRGYAAGEMPPGVEQSVLTLCERMLNGSHLGISSERIGDLAFTVGPIAPQSDVLSVCRAFRRPGL